MGENLASGSIGHATSVSAEGVNDVRNIHEVWSMERDGLRAWIGFAVDSVAQEAIVLHVHNPLPYPLHIKAQWRGNSTREATVRGEAHWAIPNGIRKWVPLGEGIDTDFEGLEVTRGN